MAGSTEVTAVGGGPAAPVAGDFAALLQLLLGADPSAVSLGTPAQQFELQQLKNNRLNLGNNPAPANIGAANELDKQIAELEAATRGGAGVSSIASSDVFKNLQSLIKGADISGTQESLQTLIQANEDRSAANLRERFTAGGGGVSAGTPAAVAESLFRAEAGPRGQVAVQQLDFQNRAQQMQVLLQLLNLTGGFAARGFPAAENLVIQRPGAFDTLASLATAGGGLATGIGSLPSGDS